MTGPAAALPAFAWTTRAQVRVRFFLPGCVMRVHRIYEILAASVVH